MNNVATIANDKRDTEMRRLKKIKIALMRNPMFALMSGIMMVGKTYIDDKMPTACTNGRDETYGRGFIKTLKDQELAFVVMHENYHKAYRHMTMWQKLHKEDPELANAACDFVINQQLVDLDPNQTIIAMPQKDGKHYGCLDKRFKGMHTKQVFDILKAEKKKAGGSGKKFVIANGGDGFDEHDWDGAEELTEQEKEELAREIDQALRQGQITQQKLCGKGPGSGMDLEIGELLTPKVDWREELREFLKATCNAKDNSSWRRVNRRFIGDGVYMPTLVGEKVGTLAIGVDTSGSISQDDLRVALTEVKAIVDMVHPEKIELMYWGSSVVGHETYTDSNMSSLIETTKPKDGGGTDPTTMMPFMKKEKIDPACIIMLTDGCIGDWGSQWPAPILWVMCGRYAAGVQAPVGKSIHITAD